MYARMDHAAYAQLVDVSEKEGTNTDGWLDTIESVDEDDDRLLPFLLRFVKWIYLESGYSVTGESSWPRRGGERTEVG